MKEDRDPFKYAEKLKKRGKELEKEMEALQKKFQKGEIGREEYEFKRKAIEREFIEVMDRLVQMRYVTGEENLYG